MLDQGEQCDDGNNIDTDACVNCQNARCGDGKVRAGVEECDDGNSLNTDACTNACKNAVCGDGFVRAGVEQCDDGNTVTETTCPYGTGTCTTCSATCQNFTATGNVCGDGILDPEGHEVCDDRNVLACGQCNSTCSVVQNARATGLIFPASGTDLVDGDTFVLDDGINPPTTFEFTNGTAQGTNIKIGPFSSADNNVAMRAKIITAINGVAASLLITAANGGGALVTLTHDRATSRGNKAITENVATANFQVFGMQGGQAGDCTTGQGCTQAGDCASNSCVSGVCN
ncbi:MAG: DUF4215 domain-containing protein [Deltaproteobacteria bacterium]|nr:DUF4215 domain-containing protein [Deltaproteobacteria bacterium]